METRIIDSSNARSWAEWFLAKGLETKEIVNRLSKGGWRFTLEGEPEIVYVIKNPKQLVYLLYNPDTAKPAVF